MVKIKYSKESGFSLIELLITSTLVLVLLGLATTLLAGAFRTRTRETDKTDALTSAQGAINIVTREIANSGYGLAEAGVSNNGLVYGDSNAQRLHFRANLQNNNLATDTAGEDITYFFDSTTQSILRYDKANNTTTVIIDRISTINFSYYDYVGTNSTPTINTTPSINTGRIRLTITVQLDPVPGQPNQSVVLVSDVTLRNSAYMLNQY